MAQPGVRLATRQFLTPDGAPYLEVQVEIMAEGLQWLTSSDSLVRAGVEWTVAYDTTGAVVGFSKATAWTGALTQAGDFVDIARIHAPGPHVLESTSCPVPNGTFRHEMVVDIDAPNSLDISDLFLVQAIAPAAEEPTALTVRRVSWWTSGFRGRIRPSMESCTAPTSISVRTAPSSWWLASRSRRAIGFGNPAVFRKVGVPVLPLLESIPVPFRLYDLCVECANPAATNGGRVEWPWKWSEWRLRDAARTLSPFVLLHQDRDSLHALVETLLPIADAGERRSIEYSLKEAELRPLQAFLDQFWLSRSPEAPAESWREYRREVAIADAEYGDCPNREGHETDMGWILLRYGRPNTIVQRHNGTQYYPYEIWHYHKAGQFNNRRFLFYTPQVVGECFELLHSDHPQEIRNADWLDILKTRELGHVWPRRPSPAQPAGYVQPGGAGRPLLQPPLITMSGRHLGRRVAVAILVRWARSPSAFRFGLGPHGCCGSGRRHRQRFHRRECGLAGPNCPEVHVVSLDDNHGLRGGTTEGWRP